MTHRERVTAALNHEEPDRCPMQVSFTPEFAARLRADLSTKGHILRNPPGGGNTYELERATDQDMLLTSVGWLTSYYQKEGSYVDEWGVTWTSVPYTTPFGIGRYTDVVGRPLADHRALSTYKPPDPGRPELYKEAESLISNFKHE